MIRKTQYHSKAASIYPGIYQPAFMGFREQEGFIDEHDRRYGTPIPDHISAKWKDIELLIDALIATDQNLKRDHLFDAVIAAALFSFGFVLIHPLL